MVPFSFSSDPVKVACDAKIYIVIFGDAGSLESGAFALSCLVAFLMVIPAGAKKPQIQAKSHQITPNQTKSNQITPNHTKSHQITPNHTKSHQIKPNQTSFFISPLITAHGGVQRQAGQKHFDL
jgi:hypothetical protein